MVSYHGYVACLFCGDRLAATGSQKTQETLVGRRVDFVFRAKSET